MNSSSSNPGQPAELQYAGGDRPAIDAEHLNLLSVFHYIVGGLVVLMSCMFLAVIVMGMDMMDRDNLNHAEGFKVLIAGIMGLLLGWVLAVLIMLTGYYIAHLRARTFTLFIAAINLLLFPFGTLLGIVTFVVMKRDSIRLLYAEKSAGA